MLGDAALQGFGADAWALGLSLLHLLTGACPYEETLAGVRCPAPLRDALERVWTLRPPAALARAAAAAAAGAAPALRAVSGVGAGVAVAWADAGARGAASFSRTVARALGGGEPGECATVLADALYRFCVLLGLGNDAAGADAGPFDAANPVWALLLAVCGEGGAAAPAAAAAPEAAPGRKPRAKAKAAAVVASTAAAATALPAGATLVLRAADAADCRRRFAEDRAIGSLASGTHPLLQRARRRAPRALLAAVERGLLAWAPSARLLMRDLLLGGAFAALEGGGDGAAAEARVVVREFAFFACSNGDVAAV